MGGGMGTQAREQVALHLFEIMTGGGSGRVYSVDRKKQNLSELILPICGWRRVWAAVRFWFCKSQPRKDDAANIPV